MIFLWNKVRLIVRVNEIVKLWQIKLSCWSQVKITILTTKVAKSRIGSVFNSLLMNCKAKPTLPNYIACLVIQLVGMNRYF